MYQKLMRSILITQNRTCEIITQIRKGQLDLFSQIKNKKSWALPKSSMTLGTNPSLKKQKWSKTENGFRPYFFTVYLSCEKILCWWGDVVETRKLLAGYFEWCTQKYRINSFDAGDEIVTPFLNSLGDNIAIYLIQNDDGTITFSDDGATLNDLSLAGLDVSSDHIQQIIISILRSSEVDLGDSQLIVTGEIGHFPEMFQTLFQTILRIDTISSMI